MVLVYVYNDADSRGALSNTPFFQVQNNTERSVHNLLQEKYKSSKETFKSQSPPATIESYIRSEEGLDPQLQCSAEDDDDTLYLASSLLGENKTHISQTETSTEKIPSNVKKLIGTFESSLFQVMFSYCLCGSVYFHIVMNIMFFVLIKMLKT